MSADASACIRSSEAAPLHLYVHIPFCVHKCAYCDFNSHVRAEPPWGDYRDALLVELAGWAHRPQFSGRHIATVFFGGGTPSLAPPGLVAAVLERADCLLGLHADAEISLEANPGTLDADRFAGYRAAGVNRLSIGVQSFNDAELQWLERIHNSRQASLAVQTARRAGFDNLSLDLMYGLPGQGLDIWMHNLEQAIALGPEHLSCYQLTVEAHTELARRHRRKPLALPEEEEALQMLHATRERLDAAGFMAYEISNFAHPGRNCRHNDAYWQYRDYIGVGAGSAGKWDEADGGITRYANIRSPEGYMQALMNGNTAINSRERLARGKAAAEAAWLGLRRSAGIERAAFRQRFGADTSEMFGSVFTDWQAGGHIEIEAGHIRLSNKGLGLADSIAVDLLTCHTASTSETASKSA